MSKTGVEAGHRSIGDGKGKLGRAQARWGRAQARWGQQGGRSKALIRGMREGTACPTPEAQQCTCLDSSRG